MRILQFLGHAFPPPLPDGRFITRPWGRFGPSYAMTAGQRAVRSKIHVALYVMLFTAIYLMPSLTARYDTMNVVIVAVALLYPFIGLLFSIGLPKIDEPPRRTPEQIRTAMSGYARAVGRSRLRLYLTMWCVPALASGAIAVLVPEARFSGLWCFLVFALGAAATRELLVLASDDVIVDPN